MHPHVTLIWHAIKADIDDGKIIDVDRYGDSLASVCPELTQKQVRDLVLELVGVCGGGAVWGADPDGPGHRRAAANVSRRPEPPSSAPAGGAVSRHD